MDYFEIRKPVFKDNVLAELPFQHEEVSETARLLAEFPYSVAQAFTFEEKVGPETEPPARGFVTINGVPAEMGTLTVDTSAISNSDGLGTFSYQWLRNGSAILDPIQSTTSASYGLFRENGNSISVVVTYVDGSGVQHSFISEPTDAIVGHISFRGTDAADYISGDLAGDVLSGMAGDDTISGNGGADVLDGGPGNDILRGGSGRDNLDGEGGDDTLRGGSEIDYLQGGRGNDSLFGNGGEDYLIGNRGNDRLFGNGGQDFLIGNRGNDTLKGGGSWDQLVGGSGQDELHGNRGNDWLWGRRGDDILVGGLGEDRFMFTLGDGHDTITDFEIGVDHFEIGRGASRLGQLDFEQQGDNVIVSFRNVEITIEDATVDAIAVSDNFLFV